MVNTRTIALVKEFEGYGKKLADGRCLAYLDRNATPENANYDHTAGGLWTIGYGATGSNVREGTIWTQAQADNDLGVRLEQFARQVDAKLTVKVNENQRGALASIAYNIGVYGIRGLIDHVNQDPSNAGQYFMAYNHGHVNGVLAVMAGLTRRRAAERELYEWETIKEVKALSPQMQQADTVQTGLAAGGFSIAGIWSYLPQVQEMARDHIGLILLSVLGMGFGVSYLWKRGFHVAFNDGSYVPVGTKPVPTEVSDADLN
jgi:lysozyme